MDLKEIRKIVELMNEHGLSHFHLEMEDVSLKLKKGSDLEDLQALLRQMPSAAPAPAIAPSPAAAQGSPATQAAAPTGEEINSPMVGTYYEKPAPDAPPFLKVGDSIAEGQTLCIIEAMKVMNEITAETSGVIAEICVEDASPVQFGDTLFRLK